MKIELYILIIITATLSSCSHKFNRTGNLSKTQIYLQSVNHKAIQSNEYGYTIENPIVLKLSQEFDNDQIINEYIKRLWRNGEGESIGNMQSFKVVENSKIPINSDQRENESNDNNYKNWVYKYKIISDDGNFKETLYFTLNTRKIKFYIPTGFLYSMYCG